MNHNIIQIQKWRAAQRPTEVELQRQMEAEGLRPTRWENTPFQVYEAHEHQAHKVIYVVSGTMTFGFPIVAEPTTLEAGDRLDLPPGVRHNAVVGSTGAVYLEAYRNHSGS